MVLRENPVEVAAAAVLSGGWLLPAVAGAAVLCAVAGGGLRVMSGRKRRKA